MYDIGRDDDEFSWGETIVCIMFMIAIALLIKEHTNENNRRLPEAKTEFAIACENCPFSK